MTENNAVMVVDLGFSSAKYMFGEIKGRVPSGFRSKVGGYLYGEEALVKAGSSYLKTPEELVHHYPAFVDLCMRKAGVSPDQKIDLAVGLPYLFFKMENRPGGSVEHLASSLKKNNVENVTVLPQGLGGVKSYLDSSDEASGNILAVDIGFNTVIFTLFNVELGEIIYGNTFNKRGIHQMANDHVLPRIAQLTPARTLTPLEISIVVERGAIQYGFESFDIRGEVHDAAQEYVKAVMNDIYGEIQAESGTHADAPVLLLFGGGAALLSGKIPGNAPFRILPEPEYANARGFKSYLEG